MLAPFFGVGVAIWFFIAARMRGRDPWQWSMFGFLTGFGGFIVGVMIFSAIRALIYDDIPDVWLMVFGIVVGLALPYYVLVRMKREPVEDGNSAP